VRGDSLSIRARFRSTPRVLARRDPLFSRQRDSYGNSGELVSYPAFLTGPYLVAVPCNRKYSDCGRDKHEQICR